MKGEGVIKNTYTPITHDERVNIIQRMMLAMAGTPPRLPLVESMFLLSEREAQELVREAQERMKP